MILEPPARNRPSRLSPNLSTSGVRECQQLFEASGRRGSVRREWRRFCRAPRVWPQDAWRRPSPVIADTSSNSSILLREEFAEQPCRPTGIDYIDFFLGEAAPDCFAITRAEILLYVAAGMIFLRVRSVFAWYGRPSMIFCA